MIVYGSRMYFKQNVVRSFGDCDHCGKYGKQTSYRSRKFGHIYFIPLIPLGAKSQVLRECKKCNMGAHVPTDELEPRIDALADQFKSWITAIGDGETELQLDPDQPPANIGLLVAGILDDLYCLKEIENVDSIVSILDANGLTYEREIVLGRWHEIQGDLENARLNYQAAHRAQPSESAPVYQLGLTEIKLGNIPAAEETFARYLKLNPDDMSPYIELAGVYERQKNHPKLVETYDILYANRPEIVTDKGMKKIYKRACKKSGVQGKFLAEM